MEELKKQITLKHWEKVRVLAAENRSELKTEKLLVLATLYHAPLDVVTLLLEAGCDVNERDEEVGCFCREDCV